MTHRQWVILQYALLSLECEVSNARREGLPQARTSWDETEDGPPPTPQEIAAVAQLVGALPHDQKPPPDVTVPPELTVTLRECFVRWDDLRQSTVRPSLWPAGAALKALVVETLAVRPEHARKGHCRRFLMELTTLPGRDLVVVEGVVNPILRDALVRWGWHHDPHVQDYYRPLTDAAWAALEKDRRVIPPRIATG